MIEQFLNKIQFGQWSWLVPWLFGISVIAFIGSIVGVWIVLIRLPEDYLVRERAPESVGLHRPLKRLIRKIIKNMAGVGFLIAGIGMLFTPGQGILCIVVGITLMDFPGKKKLIRKILAYPKVLNAVNKLRTKAHKPPLRPVNDSIAVGS